LSNRGRFDAAAVIDLAVGGAGHVFAAGGAVVVLGDRGHRGADVSTSDLLALTDFERFEVVGTELHWRLVRTSPDHYTKRLSIYDGDRTNDPDPPEACFSDDIIGVCHCDFSGPAVTVSIEGTTSLVRR
jgi:hypothetical protein